MKSVFLKAYSRNNLGDDLFIYVICNRYKNKFTLLSNKKLPYELRKLNNLKVLNNYIYTLYKKFFKKGKLYNFKEQRIKNKSDIFVYIGGSIFIEYDGFNRNNLFKEFSHPQMYILGSNFGPYFTKTFLLAHKEMFKNAKDVCFRDNYSYSLFNNISSCRVESDILFSIDYSSYISNKKKVCISVIDCNNKDKGFTKIYENFIIDIINKYFNLNYEVVLMSFCEAEGDEVAIDRIISKIDNLEIKNKIKKFGYKNSLNDALKELGSSEIIIGSRFHANIIGLSMNKVVIPVAYSDKTLNVLKDINFKGRIFDIRHLDEFDVNLLTDKDLEYKINVDKYRKDAEKHFEKLDQVLERR